MEFSSAVMWLVAGLVLAAAEIFVGTFYLLVMGVACIAAALVAWGDMTTAWQLSVFAVALLIGGVAVRYLKSGKSQKESEMLQNPDVGQRVTVSTWKSDKTAEVHYRGAQWTAVAVPEAVCEPGQFEIVEVQGARLVLKNASV